MLFMPSRKEHFKFTDDEIKICDKADPRVEYSIIGGEHFALTKLNHLFADRTEDTDPVGANRDRDALEFGSAHKFSPWINSGCLSIRYYFFSWLKELTEY
jgi:deoxyribodipyrimidine photolyase